MNKQDLKSIDFYESRERFAMNQLYEVHIKPVFEPFYNVSLYLTPTFRQKTTTTLCYDAILYLRDKVTMNIIYKFIIEIKYRDSDYDSMMLEKSKYKSLLKQQQEAIKYSSNEDIAILYVNFTPSGTYIFNLSSDKINNFIKNNKNKVKEKLVKTTYIQNDKEINKDVYYLPKSLGKRFNLTSYKDYHLIYELNDVLKPSVEVQEKIKTYSIF